MAADSPVLVLTPGEPAGIGPEISVRLAARQPDRRIVMVADPDLLATVARRQALDVQIAEWSPGDGLQPGRIACSPVSLGAAVRPGALDTANAPYVLDCLRRAVQLVAQDEAAALVTGPVHKGVINDAGIAFSGHTEFLAALAGVPRVVMLLVAGELRVALATTHLALRAVPDAITAPSLLAVLNIMHADLQQRFGIDNPRIRVLGLNPHAGEGGHLGDEERKVIEPAIAQARASGMRVSGPASADTAFTPDALAGCDAILAMYHDQGLPVLKHAGFGEAVNVTLGLPFIRTSVDHGTALDIAGTGTARCSSLAQALDLAERLAKLGR